MAILHRDMQIPKVKAQEAAGKLSQAGSLPDFYGTMPKGGKRWGDRSDAADRPAQAPSNARGAQLGCSSLCHVIIPCGSQGNSFLLDRSPSVSSGNATIKAVANQLGRKGPCDDEYVSGPRHHSAYPADPYVTSCACQPASCSAILAVVLRQQPGVLVG